MHRKGWAQALAPLEPMLLIKLFLVVEWEASDDVIEENVNHGNAYQGIALQNL